MTYRCFTRAARRFVVPITPTFQPLESRRLFAASPVGTAAIDAASGRLDVDGTKRADEIRVDLNSNTGQIDVTINGAPAGSFPLAQLPNGIRIEAGKGNDTVLVGSTVNVPVEIRGAAGNDDLTGGGGNDVVDGGPGRDHCDGAGGDDNVTGGNGADDLLGGPGRDTLDGGNGNDTCNGGADDDSVDGGNGRDHLLGELGDDRIRGGNGADDCDGGDGNDDIDGERGRDNLTGGNGTDDFQPDDHGSGGHGADDNVTDRGPGEEDDDQQIAPGEIPPAVLTTFNQLFPNSTIREVEREQEDNGVVIKIDFLNAGRRMRAEFSEAGQLLSQETR